MRSFSALAVACTVAALAAASPALGAPAGSLDPTFQGTGFRSDQIDLGPGTPFSFNDAIVATADGRIFAATAAQDASALTKVTVSALDGGGALNPAWASVGISRNAAFSKAHPADVPYTLVTDAALAPDGKLVVAGWGGVDDFHMLDTAFVQRYRTDGTLDPGFGDAGTVRFSVPSTTSAHEAAFSSVAVDSAGRVVAAGGDNAVGSGDVQSLIVRFKPDGTLDPTFGGTGYVTAQYDTVPPLESRWIDLALAPDDSLVLLGAVPDRVVAKVSASGVRDPAYGPDGFAHVPQLSTSTTGLKKTTAAALALMPDGRVVVGGGASWRQGAGPDFDVFESWIGRFTAAGQLDPAFDGDGIAVWRFGEDGAGTWADSFVRDLAVQANGSIVAVTQAGSTDGQDLGTSDGLVIRVRGDGSLDPLFGTGGQSRLKLSAPGQSTLLGTLALAPGRKIALAGGIRGAGGATAAGVVRLIGDGDPVASLAAPAQVVVGKTAALDASASADDWAIASYGWDLNGDGVFGDATGPAIAPLLSLGTHTVAVRVTDDAGQSALASAKVKVVVPFTVKLPKSLKLLGSKVKVPVTCTKAGPCQGTLTLLLKVRSNAARLVSVRVGQASFSVRRGQRKLVAVTVARRVRRNVARHGKATVSVAIRARGVDEVLQRSVVVLRRR
ncbi:MAG TPA: PKD domain-containing protein [Solirubrobacteraceae bacterium]